MVFEYQKPDFIGIGGARCGSTWLYKVLRAHSEIWLPPKKELHYFDRDLNYPSPSILYDRKLIKRLLSLKSHNLEFKKMFVRSILKELITLNYDKLKWKAQYFTGDYNDTWYINLFRGRSERLVGEITPAYSILYENDVRKIKRITPEAKIIFLIRDPIDRAWSQIRKNKQTDAAIARMMEIIKSEDMLMRSNYLRTIKIWRKVYGDEKIFIGFYEDIKNSPGKIVAKILQFLGLNYENSIDTILHQKVNKSKTAKMKPEIKEIMKDVFKPLIREMSENIGGYSREWCKKYYE